MNPNNTRPEINLLPAATVSMPRVRSEALLQGGKAATIEHAGQQYILRLTRENKLILTK